MSQAGLYWGYTNEPNVHLRDERLSEMHQGATIIETHGPSLRPTTLTAKYWNDRKCVGSMDFTMRIDEVHTRLEDAARAFSAGEGHDVEDASPTSAGTS
tara:strand:- start:45530 stop:45826 length:297 start_codon:yes stop_codon:yes gene_type:complete